MKVIFLILLCCLFVNAQSSNELRQKYGAPTSETFTEIYQARPFDIKTGFGVSVTVTYNKAKEIRQLKIEISPYPKDVNDTTAKGQDEIKTKLLREVVDELVPIDKRGKHIINGFVNLACLPQDGCFGTFEKYEKLTIYYNGNSHLYATINWKVISYD